MYLLVGMYIMNDLLKIGKVIRESLFLSCLCLEYVYEGKMKVLNNEVNVYNSVKGNWFVFFFC